MSTTDFNLNDDEKIKKEEKELFRLLQSNVEERKNKKRKRNLFESDREEALGKKIENILFEAFEKDVEDRQAKKQKGRKSMNKKKNRNHNLKQIENGNEKIVETNKHYNVKVGAIVWVYDGRTKHMANVVSITNPEKVRIKWGTTKAEKDIFMCEIAEVVELNGRRSRRSAASNYY